MLSTIHILLTYKCPLRCDHCYVFGGPKNTGQFTGSEINQLLDQAQEARTVEWIVFDGGEPFLCHPLLLQSLHKAQKLGFRVAVITNGFFARSEASAGRYLRPLAKLKIDRIYLSVDMFHYHPPVSSPAWRAGQVAMRLGLPIVYEDVNFPGEQESSSPQSGEAVGQSTSRLLMVGRAAEKLAGQIPGADRAALAYCPNSSLASLDRLFIDALGNVQVCPGLSIGNIWYKPLSEIVGQYKPEDHPICSRLILGGPALLSATYNIRIEKEIVDGCHLCYLTRRALLDRFPNFLAPHQVYGIY
jgi:hypothetical protein